MNGDEKRESQQLTTTSLSATATTGIMATSKVWCLLIDHTHNPSFGEPFPVYIHRDDTVHELKLKVMIESFNLNRIELVRIPSNEIEIWRCKSLKLSAKDSFGRTKKQLSDFKFSDDEDSDVLHVGVAAQVISPILFRSLDELWLVVVPRIGQAPAAPSSAS